MVPRESDAIDEAITTWSSGDGDVDCSTRQRSQATFINDLSHSDDCCGNGARNPLVVHANARHCPGKSFQPKMLHAADVGLPDWVTLAPRYMPDSEKVHQWNIYF